MTTPKPQPISVEPEQASEGGAAPKPKTAAEAAYIAVCAVSALFFALIMLTYGYGRDQGIYAVVARTITEGGMPYRDAWDFKPPGIFIIYALARLCFGNAQYGIRVFEAICIIGMIPILMRLSRLVWGERLIGLAAGAVNAFVQAELDFWHTSQPESFGGLFTMAGMLLAVQGEMAHRQKNSHRKSVAIHWIGSGVLFGIAGLLKPPLAGGGAVLALIFALRSLRAPEGSSQGLFRAWLLTRASIQKAFTPILYIAAGGVLPIALCALWFAFKGALSDLYQVLFVFTPHYTALGWEGSSLFGMIYWGFIEWLATYCSLMTVGVLLFFAIGLRTREHYGALLFSSVIAIHLVGVIMQGKFFAYHYGATWPPTAMLAGYSLFWVWNRYARRSRLREIIFYLGIVIVSLGRSATKHTPESFRARTLARIRLFSQSPRDQAAIDRLAWIAEVHSGVNRAAGEFIKANVPADRPIFVWGFEPVIYDFAERPLASRYIYNVPQRVAWAKAEARKALMREISAHPPAAIVVEHHDVFPHVTGDAIDSADSLADFGEFNEMLHTKYQMATTINTLDIYLELPSAQTSD